MGLSDIIKNTLFPTVWPLSPGQSFSIGSRRRRRHSSQQSLVREYEEMVFACVEARAQETAKLELISTTTKQGATVRDLNDPLLTLLKHPNPNQTWTQFIEYSETLRLLTGEVLWVWTLGEKTRLPFRVDVVPSWQLQDIAIQETVDPTGQHLIGDVIGYIILDNRGTPVPIDKNQVSHLKTVNPTNPYRGTSLVQAGLKSILVDQEISEFQLSFLENNAMPSSIVTAKSGSQPISDKEFEGFKALFNSRHQGSENAGRSFFMRDVDVDIKKLGLGLDDLDLKDLKKLSMDRVRIVFRTPKSVIADHDSAGLSRANVETDEYIFQKYPVDWAKRIYADEVDAKHKVFYPRLNSTIGYVSTVPQDKEFLLKKLEAELNVKTTVNESRREDGLDPVDGGDRLYIPFNMVPIDTVATIERNVSPTTIKITEKTTIRSVEDVLFERISKLDELHGRQIETKLREGLVLQQKKISDLLALMSGRKSIVLLPTENEILTMLRTVPLADMLIDVLLGAVKDGADLALLLNGMPDADWEIGFELREKIWDATDRLMERFDDRTAHDISQNLAQMLDAGASAEEIDAELDRIFNQKKQTDAERLARTEAHLANQQGLMEGYKTAGYTFVEWVAESGACEYCREQNGQRKAIGSYFILLGDMVEGEEGGSVENTWRDIDTPPAHANCRCIVMPAESSIAASISDDDLATALKNLEGK